MGKGKAETPDKKTLPGKPPGGKKKEELFPIETLAKDIEMPAWEQAALMRAAGWAPGKQVSKKQFESALKNFRHRPQGGGRIKA